MSTPKKSPLKTPKYHRTVFGNTSPNLVNHSTNSIYAGSNGILSPNFNVVNSDWSSKLSRKNKTFGDKLKESPRSDKSLNLKRATSGSLSIGRKLRRTNTNEFDRFIPSRQSTSGKLSVEKTISLPSFALPIDRIESQHSEIYQSTVAEACGLEVGQRILQFQPPAPAPSKESNSLRKVASQNKFKTRQIISTTAAQARMKRIPSCPEKVLDAPELTDDFYLNLISWSEDNNLAIALGKSAYCWNANDGSVNLITTCELVITSLRWSQDGYFLSIGLDDGSVEIWDIEKNELTRKILSHCGRISSQSWNEAFLTMGSRMGSIFHNDLRISNCLIDRFENHTGEVCGLEWRSDGLQLASGGNDNVVNIWDSRLTSNAIHTKTAHSAAVKALAWCPTQLSLLASGGGSACKKIHFWNTNTGNRVNTIDTESQVSSLTWGYSNGIGKEIVSTHGFPHNEVSVYSYPTLQKTGVIMNAHEGRILNSQLSPNGTVLATLGSDENLKFWKLFDEPPMEKDTTPSRIDKVIR